MNHTGTQTQRIERQRREEELAKEARMAGELEVDPSSFLVSWVA
jgi:hypothetical protein